MRGAQLNICLNSFHSGIIPAYAGSTGFCHCKGNARWDHPRVCGEHRLHQAQGKGIAGSSPRMRGARQRRLEEAELNGIIPAYAGSTETTEDGKNDGKDHPRVCGEHPYAITSTA